MIVCATSAPRDGANAAPIAADCDEKLTVIGNNEALVFRPKPPFGLEVDMISTSCTELAALAPGTQRTGPRTVRFEAKTVQEMIQTLLAWMYLARHAAPQYKVD